MPPDFGEQTLDAEVPFKALPLMVENFQSIGRVGSRHLSV